MEVIEIGGFVGFDRLFRITFFKVERGAFGAYDMFRCQHAATDSLLSERGIVACHRRIVHFACDGMPLLFGNHALQVLEIVRLLGEIGDFDRCMRL
ncbi:hypothetical protein D1872_294530 [compost metagenome]